VPNLDPCMNQENEEEFTTPTKFENDLLSIKDERQEMIRPNCHPTFNELYQKIIELIDWTLEKYKTAVNKKKRNKQVIIDNIIEELDKKRNVAINKKAKNSSKR